MRYCFKKSNKSKKKKKDKTIPCIKLVIFSGFILPRDFKYPWRLSSQSRFFFKAFQSLSWNTFFLFLFFLNIKRINKCERQDFQRPKLQIFHRRLILNYALEFYKTRIGATKLYTRFESSRKVNHPLIFHVKFGTYSICSKKFLN